MRRGILAGRDELEALGQKISKRPFEQIYETLRQRCDLILEAAPVPERQWRMLWIQGRRGAAVQAARTTQGRIMDLVVAHHIDANLAYRDRAIEELKGLICWTTWTDPSDDSLPADLCTAESAVAAVVGLDWLWEDLSEAERQAGLEAVRHKAIEPYLKSVSQKAWWYDCYHHWNAVINAGCGLAGLMLGDDEEGRRTLALARAGLEHFFDALGKEGGWDEGTGHWGYAMRYVLLLAEGIYRMMDDQTLFQRRGMDHTGLFPIYFTPNGQPAGFGTSAVPLYGTLYLLQEHHELPELAWWLDTYSFRRDVTTSGYSAAAMAMLFRPADADTPETPRLEPVKVFGEIGWAAMADAWPRPGLYAAVKTGDLSANNRRRDMNSVQIQANGEMLVAQHENGSEGPQPGTDDFYEVRARAYNTIVVGQRDHQIDAQGGIEQSAAGADYRWLCCNANSACGENVRFIRHVVMLLGQAGTGKAIVVLDDITDSMAEEVDMFWHTRGPIEMDPTRPAGVIRGRRSELHFALASTRKLRTRTETHQFNSHFTDNLIWSSTRVKGRTLLLSVFATEPMTDVPRLKVAKDDAVRITAAGAELSFVPARGRLALENLTQ